MTNIRATKMTMMNQNGNDKSKMNPKLGLTINPKIKIEGGNTLEEA